MKKCAFLQEVKRICDVKKVEIFNQRIEKINNFYVDLVVARALTGLNDLINYAYRYTTKYSKYIFLKTQNIDIEILEAKKNWIFDYQIIPSVSDKRGLIVILENINRVK